MISSDSESPTRNTKGQLSSSAPSSPPTLYPLSCRCFLLNESQTHPLLSFPAIFTLVLILIIFPPCYLNSH